jgi:hypothetical protein
MASCPESNSTISGCNFTSFLVNELPRFDEEILKDIRPTDQWMLHVPTGVYKSYDGVQKYLDRFNHVWPNTTKTWTNTVSGNCVGTPCDKTEYHIGWGSTRTIYSLEEQSWASALLCFDNDMHITQAREQYEQIISDILRPATVDIMSMYSRKRAAMFAQQQYICNSNFGGSTNTFAYNWVVVGTSEIYIDTNANPANVFKLTPQMLQRRKNPLERWGYFGKQPYKDMPKFIELVIDEQVKWDLDKLGGQNGIGGIPSISGNWRFTEWEDVSKYWKYDYEGTIGNYAIRVDPLNLRFNYVGLVGGNYRYQVVLPYVNVTSSGAGTAPGLKDIPNPDFDNAQYCFNIVWHRMAGEILVSEAGKLNSEMPFADRNFAGRWQFVMDNLGADINGQPIENKRRNKGQFIADFKQAWKPRYTELSELYFSMREPACIIQISACNPSPGYPMQNYNSAPVDCNGNVI